MKTFMVRFLAWNVEGNFGVAVGLAASEKGLLRYSVVFSAFRGSMPKGACRVWYCTCIKCPNVNLVAP